MARRFGLKLRWLLVSIAAFRACGRELRVLRLPPDVNAGQQQLESAAAIAKVSALISRGRAAEQLAEASAAQAHVGEMRTQEILTRTQMVIPEINMAEQVSAYDASTAQAASTRAVEAAKAAVASSSTAAADAKSLAVAEIKRTLESKYRELGAWREKVLRDPAMEAKRAAAKAAEPYYERMRGLYQSVNSYQSTAGGLQAQAMQAAESAKALAASAKSREEAGDTIGAAQDDELSKALDAQSSTLNGQAQNLQQSALTIHNTIPEYLNAGVLAGWRAEYMANPDALPPAPLDANFAYTPQPSAQLSGWSPSPAPAR